MSVFVLAEIPSPYGMTSQNTVMVKGPEIFLLLAVLPYCKSRPQIQFGAISERSFIV